ncbi:MAG: hydrogenase formation protein HypD [Lachnospiraceae bacterium]|nr:hydrogenase formation protein HypD [Lachnospiraceae bacterium]MBQ5484316.1 hydrogenase formation protein HypD [Lachnospiraceae bacterium]
MAEDLKKEDGLAKARRILQNYDGPKVRIMEVCGTHTHEIFRQGVRRVLSPQIEMISGPGCPVCVTAVTFIDEAISLALDHGCTITTFGDLVRVPGTKKSLQIARGEGANVKVVYTPLDAVAYAKDHPQEEVVFLAVGFETTTPSECLAVEKAMEEGLTNFSLLTANKTMPAAYEAMKDATDLYLYPGHVHAIIGNKICEDMLQEGVSGVVGGFTGKEILTALAVGVTEFQKGKPFFKNCYPRVVTGEGSPQAMELVDKMMEPCDQEWRGIGLLKNSGMQLRGEYAAYDARKKFDLSGIIGKPNPACRCGQVLQGAIKPHECPCFGTACTPEHPVGACMVSSEGACSAWYLYGDLANKPLNK